MIRTQSEAHLHGMEKLANEGEMQSFAGDGKVAEVALCVQMRCDGLEHLDWQRGEGQQHDIEGKNG